MRSPHTSQAQEARQPSEQALLLRIDAVIRTTGLGRSTIYRLVTAGDFPAPVRISTRAVAWRRTDVETWSAGRPSTAH